MPAKRMGRAVRRRAVLQALALGVGVAGLGRVLFACDEAAKAPPRKTLPTSPTDDDEYIPGEEPALSAGPAPVELPNPVWEARVKQLEREQERLFRPEAFTQASPGQMAGKERSHVPSATVLDEDGVTRVVVVVQHTMGKSADAGVYDGGDGGKRVPDAGGADDAGDDAGVAPDAGDGGGTDAGASDAGKAADGTATPVHYVTTIYLRATVNGVDTVVGLWELAAFDPEPPTVKFTLPPGVTSVTAFEWCTLHGLWSGTPVAIPE